METSFEQVVSSVGRDNLGQRSRACGGRNLNSGLSTMTPRVPLGQAPETEDELARISRQGYSFSNHQLYQPEKEDFLDDFG